MAEMPSEMPHLEKQHIFSDCVIVSIQNYTGKTYSEVMDAARASGLNPVIIKLYGTPRNKIAEILTILGFPSELVTPRRGQSKLSGIAYWAHPNQRRGHATAVFHGVVLDTNGCYCTIKEYRDKKNYNLKLFHKIELERVSR